MEKIQHFRLFFRVGAFAADIVEKYGKRAHAERVERFKFFQRDKKIVGNAIIVGICPVDRGARVERPEKFDVVFPRDAREFGNLRRLFFRIGFPPKG